MSLTLGSVVRNASRILGSRVSASSYTFLCRRGSTIVTRAASEGNQVDNMATPQEMSSNKVFGGFNRRYKHESSSVGCPMTFTIFFPPAADSSKVPVLYWLSGLTCNDENFIQKSGAQRAAAAHGLALVAMDTSPRGLNVEGESDSWDFGTGASFYLNATQEKWKNWRMYDYVTKELPSLLSSHFPQLDTSNASLFGHSMGGHGALTLFLKNPSKYKSVSAFAPICNPTACPWGVKAFNGYLGAEKSAWEEYDATLLVTKYNGPKTTILIDQGDADKFYKENQLLPENFEQACKSAGMPIDMRIQPGYDHSYFFIASFVEDHIQHHAKALSV
ncbi:S-formylglutathione hydrolase isoform X1 [Physcomitrium patens]|uniref:S-formylglutathione hydrolase n=2 Tax=Physcomitrium patens TaxID=3218 RepID=A0A2K1JU13_PHYPA|nr:S-formylglutathione hydrolase-like isoform X1 [Physcomitrium patens]XP_024389402.1 S-formylglutathione hydrolase-like isoform X1 [Physcomitrium patens]PNR44996.1 hypothetical protein PHYPA_014766 [Physcomitrium patens]|eukprot:XP_024389401.1 S-formylglutathione hydrolase-like isoform X1 [Physcomitrella patens]